MTENQNFIRSTYPSSSDYLNDLARLRDLCRSSPFPSEEFIDQFALYATPASLRRFIHFDRLYQKILGLPDRHGLSRRLRFVSHSLKSPVRFGR